MRCRNLDNALRTTQRQQGHRTRDAGPQRVVVGAVTASMPTDMGVPRVPAGKPQDAAVRTGEHTRETPTLMNVVLLLNC